MPDLVLYADGRLLITRYDYSSSTNRYTRATQEAYLPPEEVCTFLFQIEADGFFDFDPAEYEEPRVSDSGTVYMTVAAWRSQHVEAYALHHAIKDGGTPPALAATYERLGNYQPPNARLYQPERVALLVTQHESNATSTEALWPLAPSLASLAERGSPTNELDNEHSLVLEGAEAAEMYALFGDEFSKQYTEGAHTYTVTIRPLLPLEQWNGENPWEPAPYPYATTPTTELTCDPAAMVATSPVPLSPAASPSAPASPAPATPSPTPIARGILAAGAPLEQVRVIGGRNKPGQLHGAWSLVVTPDGEVVVNDMLNRRLQWFSLDGVFLREAPTPSSLSFDLALGPDDTLLVTDPDHRVHVLSRDGQLLRTLEGWPPPTPRFEGSRDLLDEIASAPDGTIYLTETPGSRVVILNADGSLREIWIGPEENPFESIFSLGTDAHGNLYVASDSQNRVVKRSPEGQVTEIYVSSPANILPAADDSFYEAKYRTIRRYDSSGAIVQEWSDSRLAESRLYDMALAPDGTLFLLEDPEPEMNPDADFAIHRYSPEGEPIADFGSTRLQPDQFAGHSAFSVSRAGDLWVIGGDGQFAPFELSVTRLMHYGGNGEHLATFEPSGENSLACDSYLLAAMSDQSVFAGEPCTGEVMQFSSEGQLLQRWGERGMAPGQFNLMRAMTLAPDEQSLFIVDEGNRRISQF
ncbi:MAG TPA: hypothetical protein VF707_11665, partial [Ardenticatenaceae bacterium]